MIAMDGRSTGSAGALLPMQRSNLAISQSKMLHHMSPVSPAWRVIIDCLFLSRLEIKTISLIGTPESH
jgi:hypothetical protein